MKYREVVFHSVVLSCALGFFSGLAYGGEVSYFKKENVSQLEIYADEAPSARANIIAITGGTGLYETHGNFNYLTRDKESFTKSDINYYMFPNKDWNEEGTPIIRASKERMKRLGNLIKEIKSRNSLPIYMAGFSRGSIEASLALTQYNIDGVIIMSGMYYSPPNKKTPLYSSHLTQNIIKKTDKRILVVHHINDKCKQTPFARAKKFYNNVEAKDKKLIQLKGGHAGGNPCGAYHYHGFAGLEKDLAKQITDWVLKK